MAKYTLDNLPIDKDQYKVIALDLDDTLLRSDKTISDYTVKTLKKAQSQGYSIVIATGRHPKSAVRYMQMLDCLNDHSYAICFNGAGVVRLNEYVAFDSEVGYPLVCQESLNGAQAKELYALAKENGCKCHAYSVDRGLVIEDHNEHTQREIDNGRVGFTEIDFSALDDNEKFFKLLIVGDKEVLDELEKRIPQKISAYFSVLRSEAHYLEFIPNHAHKGTGIESLCRTLGLSKDNAMAFGDAGNDLAMLVSAGLGVAMENGFDYVKEAADVVTKSNDEDGVAFLVNKFLK